MNSLRENQKEDATQYLHYDYKLFIYVVTAENFSIILLLKIKFWK